MRRQELLGVAETSGAEQGEKCGQATEKRERHSGWTAVVGS